MKKTIYFILVAVLVSLSSCMKIDNWDEPEARFYGRVIDSYTGENLLTSQNDWSIHIWERSWKESVPQFQSLSVKQDGSYNNSKLFAGTYDMLAYGGPFWPNDTIKAVKLESTTEQDFTVTPYLQITDFKVTLNGTGLTLSCRLKAPRREGLPNLVEVKPFLSLTTFCGESNYINIPEYNNKRITVNESWITKYGDVEQSGYFTMRNLPVKPGYTYYVRIGANVNDASKKYNYSEIIKVEVPADAVPDPNVVPDNYLANASYPFSKGVWDGSRWGTAANWTANAAMLSRGGGQWGGYDGGYNGTPDSNPSLGFERWGGGENQIINGKLYQTIDLPAGQFEFILNLGKQGGPENPIRDNNGNDPRFIVVAAGTTLPDIADLATALGSESFAGLSRDGQVKVSFTLTAPTKVSVGFVVNFTSTEQNVRASSLILKKLD